MNNPKMALKKSRLLTWIRIISIILDQFFTMIRLTIIGACVLFKVFLSSFAFASNLNPEKILNSVNDVYLSNTSYGISPHIDIKKIMRS